MKKLLIINGSNINLLGLRDPKIYGFKTYDDLCKMIENYAMIIDKIQDAYGKYDRIIINAGAYTHTSIAILDALKAVNIRTVEVHLTDISKREIYRKKSFVSEFAEKIIL